MIKDIRTELTKHKTLSYKRRNIDDITDVIIHHSAMEGTPKDFSDYHVNNKNWPGLAYHYMIDKKGQIYLCNQISFITYHCQNNNSKSIGICFIGNYENDTMDSIQSWKCIHLLAHIHAVIGHFTLGYHSQYKATLCPGKDIVDKFNYFQSPLWTLKNI